MFASVEVEGSRLLLDEARAESARAATVAPGMAFIVRGDEMTTEREKFEKWASQQGLAANYEGDGFYRETFTQRLWQTWQAARADSEKEIAELRKQLAGCRKDAERYQRLRILGCAPYEHKSLSKRTVIRFQSLDAFLDAEIVAHPSRG